MEDLMVMVSQARQGDISAVGRLIVEVIPGLRGFIRLNCSERIREREALSDLTLSVCREVLVDLHRFRGESAAEFKAWLFALATSKIRTMSHDWRAGRRQPERIVDGGDAEQALLDTYQSVCTPGGESMAKEEVVRIERAFDQLSEDQRRVLTLSCLSGLSHREIALQLGKSDEATRQSLALGRARVAFAMAKRAEMSRGVEDS